MGNPGFYFWVMMNCIPDLYRTSLFLPQAIKSLEMAQGFFEEVPNSKIKLKNKNYNKTTLGHLFLKQRSYLFTFINL